MRGLALVILLTACRGGGDDDYRIIPGGDDTTISPRPDAPPVEIDAPDGGATIAGQVCLLRDTRDQSTTPTTCESTGAGGLNVTLGTQNAITADDGTFSITAPQGTNVMWHVTGSNVVTSVMPLTSTARIPALTQLRYEELLGDTGAIINAEQGSVFVRVVNAGAPLADAMVSSDPGPSNAIVYDGTPLGAWDMDATGAFGVAWIPGITGATATTVRVTPSGGTFVDVAAPVEADAITFLTVEIP